MTEARDLSVPTVLFIDCESSGLIREDLPLNDAGQPWPMQVGAMLCNEAGVALNHFSLLIKAEGRTAKENAVKVHGISAWVTAQIGVPEPRVLGLLGDLLKTIPKTSMKVVSYGNFDHRLISSAMARFAESQNRPGSFHRLWEGRPGTEFIDLQKPWCQQLCKIKTDFESNEFKWPTLDEAASIILGRAPREGHHDAFGDLLLLKDLYFEIQRRGLFGRPLASVAA